MDTTSTQPGEIPEDVQQLATELFNLARTGDGEAAQTLAGIIDQGVNVDLMNHEGNTLLMLAAYNGSVDVLKVLIDRGADINQLNDRGQSPLAGAIFKKEDEVIDVLIDAGADPRAGHPTAVDCAKMFGRDDLLARLSSGE